MVLPVEGSSGGMQVAVGRDLCPEILLREITQRLLFRQSTSIRDLSPLVSSLTTSIGREIRAVSLWEKIVGETHHVVGIHVSNYATSE